MTIEEERNKLYKLEKEILEKGSDFYYTIVKGEDDYLKYIISKRIYQFRYGVYPTNKKLFFMKLQIIGRNF